MQKLKSMIRSVLDLGNAKANRLLLILLLIDLFFIALHLMYVFIPQINDVRLDLGTDEGYSELFQYVQWFMIILLLARVARIRRSFTYISWMIFICYFLLDDALRIHETVGRHIAAHLHFTAPFGLRLQDFGEVFVSAVAGLFLFTTVAVAYVKGDQTFRKVSYDMLLLIMALAFCGVVVDLAHFIVKLGRYVTIFLELLEDGGEMIVASILVWYSFLLNQNKDHPSVCIGTSLLNGWRESKKSARS